MGTGVPSRWPADGGSESASRCRELRVECLIADSFYVFVAFRENATEGEKPKPTKPAIKCDKETHPYGGHFYMADPCLAETRIMIREL